MDELQELISETTELIRSEVPEERFSEACELLDIYRNDQIAINLIHEFYSSLPGAVEDGILEIRVMGRRKGIYLLVAVTESEGYVYLASAEGLELQGTLSEGIWDIDVADHFDFEDRRNLPGSNNTLEDLAIYEPLNNDAGICPACYAGTGEYHELGCPVEVCPWCAGQLISCNCRFEQMGQDSITEEADLIRLEDLLEQQGRIPYDQEQRPAFPSVK